MTSEPTGDPEKRRLSIRIVPLAGGKHRRYDHGAGMHRAAFECVVEILAVRRRAVDQSRAGCAQTPLVADGGAGAVIVAGVERTRDIILVAGGDAEADHVDQQVVAFRPQALRAAGRGRSRRCDRPVARRLWRSIRSRRHWSRRRIPPPKPGRRLASSTVANVTISIEKPEHRNRGQIAAFIEVENQDGNHLGFRREQHDCG